MGDHLDCPPRSRGLVLLHQHEHDSRGSAARLGADVDDSGADDFRRGGCEQWLIAKRVAGYAMKRALVQTRATHVGSSRFASSTTTRSPTASRTFAGGPCMRPQAAKSVMSRTCWST